jgi:hypothetical protein
MEHRFAAQHQVHAPSNGQTRPRRGGTAGTGAEADRSTLTSVDEEQYRDSTNLDARISLHARYGTNPVR